MAVLAIALLIFLPMLAEAGRAARNERAQKARGGVEPHDDVYPIMRIAYPVVFVAMLAEGAVRGIPATGVLAAGVAVFAVAKLVKWSAILALGPSWTFRVIVVAGDRLVATGPYRYLRHPNYLGVVGELAGVALMTGAFFSGSLALLVFGALLLKRIAVEERALKI
jgi:methyltransferase